MWNVPGEVGVPPASDVGGSGASDPMVIDFRLHQGQIDDMVEAVKTGRDPLVTGKDSRRSLELILGIYTSSKINERVVF